MTIKPVVAAANLRFRFGPDRPGAQGFDLHAGDLTVRPGEHTAFIGPSGCGKTTLLRLLTGSLAPTAGRVELLGHDLAHMTQAARRALRLRSVGVVFQVFALLDYLTALDNILLPARLGPGLPSPSSLRPRAAALASALGIAHALARRPARLSQGERQRVAIARALILRPALVVCDEPTGNLDPDRAAEAVGLILRESAAIDATVLFVTHDHALLPSFSRVVDMASLRPSAAAVPP